MAGIIINPELISVTDSTVNPNDIFGKSGEKIISELHGKYYTSSYRGPVFSYSENAITLPVNAASLVSKFTLYNPTGSGKNLELITLDWAYAVATTVVNGIGLYYSTVTQTAAGTFTTPGTAVALNTGTSVTPVCVPYSAYTANGTPTQLALCGYTGAVTSTAANVNSYNFDGRILVGPGTSVHVAMTVAASTASGFSGSISWAEHLV